MFLKIYCHNIGFIYNFFSSLFSFSSLLTLRMHSFNLSFPFRFLSSISVRLPSPSFSTDNRCISFALVIPNLFSTSFLSIYPCNHPFICLYIPFNPSSITYVYTSTYQYVHLYVSLARRNSSFVSHRRYRCTGQWCS